MKIKQTHNSRPNLTTLAETDLEAMDGILDDGLLEAVPPITRRGFLKGAGFSITGLMLAACSRAPVQKAIPLLIQPEEIIPGESLWYASTCHGCTARCGVVVKNRDGRPIKLEGNAEHPLSEGGLCAPGQSQVLGLYDTHRINAPKAGDRTLTWAEADQRVSAAIAQSISQGKEIVILTESILSPSTKHWINRFTDEHVNSRHVSYDPLSSSAIIEAQQINFGRAVLPQYHFDRADVIVSLDADFLGTWISPVEYTKAYRKKRDLTADRHSEHIHVEGRMSVTGAKADTRITMTPTEMAQFAIDLEQEVGGTSSGSTLAHDVAATLNAHRGRALVVSGSDDVGVQLLVNSMNQTLRAIGNSVDLTNPSYQRQGRDNDLSSLISDMSAGKIGTLLIHGINPLFDLPDTDKLTSAFNKVDTIITASSLKSETTAIADITLPTLHSLESWDDVESVAGTLSMTQPVIEPFTGGRSLRSNLARWTNFDGVTDDLALVKNYWKRTYPRRQMTATLFVSFWDRWVHDGHAAVRSNADAPLAYRKGNGPAPTLAKGDTTLALYSKIGIGDGRHGQNPFCQELPDPISKATWDNYAAMSAHKADALGVEQGDWVQLTVAGSTITLPAYIQAGQHDDVVAVAMGYGGIGTERFKGIGPEWLQKKPTVNADGRVGVNASSLKAWAGGSLMTAGQSITVAKVAGHTDIALTQTFNSQTTPPEVSPKILKKRPLVRNTTLDEYRKDPSAGLHQGHEVMSMWQDDHPYEGRHWGMVMDLSACTGCSACVVGCQVENNVPVVGKDEVRRRREMHWIRIDRYYDEHEDGSVDVDFQPMMCMHCDNSPCEPVCPVLATVHSSEGLNQQVYNRCVGTRFCANNCPYKVRRFNWFNYTHDDLLENMVLNPDLTVRTRGVMEKCSMCVQRIQEAKSKAKAAGIPIKDGDIQMACQQSCPADAIIFGDMNDPESEIAKAVAGPRHYNILEELNTAATVGFLTSVRNRSASSGEENSHG